jgi:hypothetical protein
MEQMVVQVQVLLVDQVEHQVLQLLQELQQPLVIHQHIMELQEQHKPYL